MFLSLGTEILDHIMPTSRGLRSMSSAVRVVTYEPCCHINRQPILIFEPCLRARLHQQSWYSEVFAILVLMHVTVTGRQDNAPTYTSEK